MAESIELTVYKRHPEAYWVKTNDTIERLRVPSRRPKRLEAGS